MKKKLSLLILIFVLIFTGFHSFSLGYSKPNQSLTNFKTLSNLFQSDTIPNQNQQTTLSLREKTFDISETEDTSWQVLGLIYPNTDVDYIDSSGKKRHYKGSLTSKQVKFIKDIFKNWEDITYEWSNGWGSIEVDLKVIQNPISSVTKEYHGYWLTPDDISKDLNTYLPLKDYDSVMVFWNSGDLPTNYWGLAEPGPIVWNGHKFTWGTVIYISDNTWNIKYPGEVLLHEWLHGLEVYYRSLGYSVPDLHAAEKLGYCFSINSWKYWYRDYIQGKVLIDGELSGISPSVWLSGSIHKINRAPPPQLLYPHDICPIKSKIQFKWSDVKADRYLLEIYKYPEMKKVYTSETDSNTAYVPLKKFVVGNTYIWQVKAIKGDKYSKVGDKLKFTIGNSIERVLFQNDFESGDDSKWEIKRGSWFVENGKYKVKNAGNETFADSLAGDTNWKDYTVEVDLKIDPESAVAITFYGKNIDNYYRFVIYAGGHSVYFQRIVGGKEDKVSDIGVLNEDLSKPLHIRLTTEGNYFKAYINNVLYLEWEDDYYKSGYFGVHVNLSLGNPLNCWFDNIKVYRQEIDILNLPSSPDLKVEIKEGIPKLNWSPSTQGTYPISGYEIYRRENISNDKKLIATVDSDTFTYVDKDVLKGKIYFYSIRAFDSKGNYSDYSDEVKVTIPSGVFPQDSIFYKVNTLSLTELVGPMIATNSNAVPIITGDEDTSPPYAVVGIASRKGRGRVIGLGHDAFLSDSEKNLDLFDNARFTANVLKWLDVNKKGKILLTTGHGEWLNSGNTLTLKQIAIDSGFTFSTTSDRLTDKLLENVGVIIIASAWKDFKDSEIESIENFVTNGGGLFILGLGWSWLGYHEGKTLDDFPMNKIGKMFGIKWIDGIVKDPTNNYNGTPTFHIFHDPGFPYIPPTDTTPPHIDVNIPNEVNEPYFTIIGKVTDKSGVKYLKINGVNVSVSSDGSFSYTITLNKGENIVTFEAEDTGGNKVRKTFTINYIKKIILKLQIGNKVMLVNDKVVEIDIPPITVEGRTLLPIRWVAEPLGADVSWDGTERKVTVSLNDTTIELWIGKPLARVNGEYKPIDSNNPKVVPMIIKGRTMLPVRFVAENLGCKVEWEASTRTVTIIYTPSNKNVVSKVITPEKGGKIELSDGASVEIPEGAIEENATISLAKKDYNSVKTPENIEKKGFGIYEITCNKEFKEPVKISLPVQRISVNDAAIYYYDGNHWCYYGGEIEDDKITCYTTHLSIWGVFEKIVNAKVDDYSPSKYGFHFENQGVSDCTGCIGGICAGMALSSLYLYLHKRQSPYYESFYQMPESWKNLIIETHKRNFQSSVLEAVLYTLRTLLETGTLFQTQLVELYTKLKLGKPVPIILSESLFSEACHEVLVYSMELTSVGKWKISFYDPNYPEETRYFVLTIPINELGDIVGFTYNSGGYIFKYFYTDTLYTFPKSLPEPKPDLYISSDSSIFWSPSNPEEGENVTIKAEIKNIGDATAYGFDTTLYIDGSSYSTIHTSSLSPGSTKIVTFSSWRVTKGCKEIKAFVDSGYDIEELREDNNNVINEICSKEVPVIKAINYLRPVRYEANYTLSFSYAKDIVIDKFDLYVPIPKEWDSQRDLVVDRISPLGGEIKEDNLGNSYWYFDKNAISNNKLTIKQRFQFTCYEVQTDLNLAKLSEIPYNTDSSLYKLYTRSSSTIQADNIEIKKFTKELVGGIQDPIDKCKKIYNYIIKNISYSNKKSKNALETFKTKKGDCGSHVALFCAMARSVGVPARPIVGYWAEEKYGFYHVWAEFYVNGVGWIPVDPTVGVDNPSVREYYFGNMDNKRFVMSKGFDLEIDNYNISLSQRFTFWWRGHWIHNPPSVNISFSLKFRRRD